MNHPSISEVSLQHSRQYSDHVEERYTTVQNMGGPIIEATLEQTRFYAETSRLRAGLGASVTRTGENSIERSDQEIRWQYNGHNDRNGKQEGIESLTESEDDYDLEEGQSDLEEDEFGPEGQEFEYGGDLFDYDGNVVGYDDYLGDHFEIEETGEHEDYDDYMGDHFEIDHAGEWECEE